MHQMAEKLTVFQK